MARQLHTISLATIAATLNTPNDIGSLQDGRVNVYARYKGLNSSVIGTLTEEQMAELNYGIAVSNQTIWTRQNEIFASAIQNWIISYVKPTTARRLTDWCGYAPSATFPILPIPTGTYKIDDDGVVSFMFKTAENQAGSVPMLSYIDNSIRFVNKYMGVAIKKVNTNDKMLYSDNSRRFNDNYEILNSRFDIKIPTGPGTYDIYAILTNSIFHDSLDSNKAQTSLAGISGVMILPFPQTESRITFVAYTYDDYISSTTTGGNPLQQASRYYLRVFVIITNANPDKSLNVSATATFKYNGNTIGTKTNSISNVSTNGTINMDLEVSNTDYNRVISGSNAYTYSVVVTVKNKTKTLTGTISYR